MTREIRKPSVLTIAGSDSGGGAGIQADLKTFTTHKVYGASVLTCLTSQNTKQVDGISAVEPAFVSQQLIAVIDDFNLLAVKTGMLLNSDIINAVVHTLTTKYATDMPKLVVDPVMVATTGARLLDPSAIETLQTKLLPVAYMITPNIPEAIILANWKTDLTCLDDLISLAKSLCAMGPKVVLLKGGHLPFDKNDKACPDFKTEGNDKELSVIDLIYHADGMRVIRHPFINTPNTHGTGCTLSASITANLALGMPVETAVERAIEFVHQAIVHSFPVGTGNGPLNHFHAIKDSLIPKPSAHNNAPFVNMLISNCEKLWNEYINHDFVKGLQDGTLPRECFIFYIKQDYHFLLHYARAHGLATYKAKTIEEAASFADIVRHIANETKLHVEYCSEWGVSLEQLLLEPESMENIAYTRYVIDKAHSGELIDVRAAIAPCLIGYGVIGKKLYNDPKTKRENNPYWKWICNYAGKEFQEAVKVGIDALELAGANLEPSSIRLLELKKTFQEATMLEVAFWQMGLNAKNAQ